jgi:elongation factor G-like protein
MGVKARFGGITVACIERVTGTGAAEDRVKQNGNPYLAGIGLRIEAAPVGHGIEFSAGIEPGRLPPAFVAATEEGVRAALGQGPAGWPVTDCVVAMTFSQYYPRQSKPHQKFDKSVSSVAADFRNLAPVVVSAALRRAGTQVGQPVNRFRTGPAQAGARSGDRSSRPLGGARPRHRNHRRVRPARRAPAVRADPPARRRATRPDHRGGRPGHVAFVVTLASERRQRLGDITAHTLVVRKAMPGPVSHHVAR